MSEERAELRSKGRSKVVDDRAAALVDGGGDWVDCQLMSSTLWEELTTVFDPEMKEFFATCSRPGKFKWESDQQINGGPKYHEPKNDEAIIEPENPDIFGLDVTGTGQDTVSLSRVDE